LKTVTDQLIPFIPTSCCRETRNIECLQLPKNENKMENSYLCERFRKQSFVDNGFPDSPRIQLLTSRGLYLSCEYQLVIVSKYTPPYIQPSISISYILSTNILHPTYSSVSLYSIFYLQIYSTLHTAQYLYILYSIYKYTPAYIQLSIIIFYILSTIYSTLHIAQYLSID